MLKNKTGGKTPLWICARLSDLTDPLTAVAGLGLEKHKPFSNWFLLGCSLHNFVVVVNLTLRCMNFMTWHPENAIVFKPLKRLICISAQKVLLNFWKMHSPWIWSFGDCYYLVTWTKVPQKLRMKSKSTNNSVPCSLVCCDPSSCVTPFSGMHEAASEEQMGFTWGFGLWVFCSHSFYWNAFPEP